MDQPFSTYCPPKVLHILQELNCTLMVTAPQANALLIQSVDEEGRFVQRPRKFPTPSAIAFSDSMLALSIRHQILLFGKIPPNESDEAAEAYLPLRAHMTGPLAIHGLDWGEHGLWMVNTEFSCLAQLDSQFSFVPKWMPPFIRELNPGDACHLNGLAMIDGKPRFVTALGNESTPGSWREKLETGGTIIEVEKETIILQNLSVPHSPKVFADHLYFLESGKGRIQKMPVSGGPPQPIAEIPGFMRGLTKVGDYLFVGLSKLRKGSNPLSSLIYGKDSNICGIAVIHEPSGNIEGIIQFEDTVEEVFEVHALPENRSFELWSPFGKYAGKIVATPGKRFFLG